MSITVVIPIKNEAEAVRATLSGLAAQTLLPTEVLLIDGGSSDELKKSCEAFGQTSFRVEVISIGPSYPGRSRNEGVRRASGEWIAFLDMGIRLDSRWLESAMNAIRSHQSVGQLGRCRFLGETFFQEAACALSYGKNAEHETVPGTVIRRSVLLEKKLFFPEDLRAAEDLIWKIAARKNGSLAPTTQATLTYSSFPRNWSGYLRKRSIYAGFDRKAGIWKKYALIALGWIGLPLLAATVFGTVGALMTIAAFAFFRGVIDPARRSQGLPAPVYALTLILAPIGDLAALLGFMKGPPSG